MKLFLGIDGGGTRTRALLADESGRVLAGSEAGLSNPGHSSDEELRAEFAKLLRDAFAGRNPADCASIFCGIAGVTCASTAERIGGALAACGVSGSRIGIDHDIRIALAGGLGGRPGIALVVGTGSSCYGRDAQGRSWQTGGWGALAGDEGSGYFLGHQAMIAAVRMADGRMQPTALHEAVFDWLAIENVAAILKRLYEEGIARHEIAAFAPTLLDFASRGDAAAVAIIARGAEDLAAMVAANHAKLRTSDAPDVVITGGLSASSVYHQSICDAIHRHLPEARINEIMMSPAAGAVMLAIEQYTGAVGPRVLETLRRTSG
jgi:glucosamine kinase